MLLHVIEIYSLLMLSNTNLQVHRPCLGGFESRRGEGKRGGGGVTEEEGGVCL